MKALPAPLRLRGVYRGILIGVSAVVSPSVSTAASPASFRRRGAGQSAAIRIYRGPLPRRLDSTRRSSATLWVRWGASVAPFPRKCDVQVIVLSYHRTAEAGDARVLRARARRVGPCRPPVRMVRGAWAGGGGYSRSRLSQPKIHHDFSHPDPNKKPDPWDKFKFIPIGDTRSAPHF